jgi:hypothetical protein
MVRRRGRLSVAKLRALREVLAGDCQRHGATSIYERCGMLYPQLPGIFRFSRPTG